MSPLTSSVVAVLRVEIHSSLSPSSGTHLLL